MKKICAFINPFHVNLEFAGYWLLGYWLNFICSFLVNGDFQYLESAIKFTVKLICFVLI